MSEDRHEPDPTDQATDTTSSTTPSTAGSVPIHGAQPADSNTQSGFEPISIRSYLAEQFGVREVATPVQPAAPVASPTDANAELAKWRERVPKLAFALKEKTAQINLLEVELERMQAAASSALGSSSSSGSGAGLKARDEHIAALELKLSGLTTSYQNSEGNLHARELELEGLRTDLQASKERWQKLTDALDAQVATSEQAQADLQLASERQATQQEKTAAQQEKVEAQQEKIAALQESEKSLQEKLDAQLLELESAACTLNETQQVQAEQVAAASQIAEQFKDQSDALEEAREGLSSLDERNEKLLETMELANLQLVSLSEDLSRLQAELLSKEQELAAKLAEQQQLSLLDTAQIQAEHSERLRDIHAQTLLVFEAVERQNLEERRTGVAAIRTSLTAEFAEQEQALQHDYVDLQYAASGLMQQIKRLQNQVAQQQQASTEARQHDASEHQQALLNVTLALEAEVSSVEQQLQEQRFRIQQLVDEQSEEPQPRIVMLGEISDANEGRSDFAQAWRNLDDHSVDEANETIRELERLLQIRGDELSAAVAARVHFLPAASQTGLPSPNMGLGADSDAFNIAKADGHADVDESDTVAGLKVQINSARAENERLRQQLDRTSAALLASDDLTQLKGVGGKLAEQLRELGISQFAQMAALDLSDLDEPEHPLYNLKGRIERNGWIEQAKALIHPLTLYGEPLRDER